MVQISGKTTPSGYTKPTPTRTSDSIVWRSAGGVTTTAGEMESGVRFSWDKNQKRLFQKFLLSVGSGYKNADISPLLAQLNLHGYEDIITDYGENVHSLILTKVCRKLNNTASEMDPDVLVEATNKRMEAKQTPKHAPKKEQDSTVDTRPSKPAPIIKTEAPSETSTPSSRLNFSHEKVSPLPKAPEEKAKPQQPSHPLLKLPKPKVSAPPPSPQVTVKKEPDTPSPFIFTASPGVSTNIPPSVEKVKLERPMPSFILPSQRTSTVPPTTSTNRKHSQLSDLHEPWREFDRTLDEAKRALKTLRSEFDALMKTKAKLEAAETVRQMENAFCDVQIYAEELEDRITGV